jgi:branched-chain amino acid transport system substrate-binding protein
VGLYAEGVKSVFNRPDYAAGRRTGGRENTFKGESRARIYDVTEPARFLGQNCPRRRVRIGLRVLRCGRRQFLNQYAQAGSRRRSLYTAFTIDELSLPLQKENAPAFRGVGQRPRKRTSGSSPTTAKY